MYYYSDEEFYIKVTFSFKIVYFNLMNISMKYEIIVHKQLSVHIFLKVIIRI